MPTLINFVVEHDFIEILDKIDPLPLTADVINTVDLSRRPTLQQYLESCEINPSTNP